MTTAPAPTSLDERLINALNLPARGAGKCVYDAGDRLLLEVNPDAANCEIIALLVNKGAEAAASSLSPQAAPAGAVEALRALHKQEHDILGQKLLDKSDDADWQGGRVNGIGEAISLLAALTASSAQRAVAPLAANPAQGVTNAAAVLQRLIARLEYFHMAPDDAVVWVGGWSAPEGYCGSGSVKAGEIRAAIDEKGLLADHASAVASGLLVCGMCGARNWERIDTGQLVRCVNCKIVTSDVTFAPATPPHSGSSHE